MIFSRHEFSHEKCSENFPEIFEPLRFTGRQKGGFVKGWFWRTYPRSGFRCGEACERTLVPVSHSGGTSECTLVPFFVPGEHPPKPPFWKTTLLSTPEFCWSEKIPQNSRDISLPKMKEKFTDEPLQEGRENSKIHNTPLNSRKAPIFVNSPCFPWWNNTLNSEKDTEKLFHEPTRESAFFSEKSKGGGGTRGRGKHSIKPLPKTGLDPPTYDAIPPPFAHALSFSLEEPGTDQTHPISQASKTGFGGALSCTFSPPKSHNTFCPPFANRPFFWFGLPERHHLSNGIFNRTRQKHPGATLV